MFTSPNMGLTIWNLATDLYDHNALAANLAAIDSHNHTNGQGNQIPTGGIANGAIIGAKIAAGAVGPTQVTGGIVALATRAAGGNLTAAYGDLIEASPGVTITLPGTFANVIVGVIAGASVSGASPVTVSGSNIYGVGLTAVSSFLLGAPGAFALLQGDGTNWNFIAGQSDSGWLPLSLATNILTGSSFGYTASARLRGDTVHLKGVLQNTTGSTDSGTLATIPSGVRPTTTLILSAGTTQSPTTVGISIAATGVMNVSNGLLTSNRVFLDGLTYGLS